MRPHILALALAAAIPAAAVAQPSANQAGAPNPAATLPDSPTGRLGQRLLDVVADGDSARVAAFVREHLGNDVRGRSPEKMAGLLVKLHKQAGSLRVERARMAGSALRMLTRSAQGNRLLGMELEFAGGDTPASPASP